jgi:endonuclease I
MKTKVLIMLLGALVLGVFSIGAQIPAYYSTVDFDQEGNALKDDLSTLIIDTHTTLIPYTSSSTDTWDVIHESDLDVTISNNVILFYGYNDTDTVTINDRTRAIADQASGFCIGYWNREHVFAKSLANPSLTTDSAGSGTDVHNLRAADCQMNSTRNNRFFNNASGNSDIVHIEDHPICDRGPGGNPEGCFYPGDEFKGDVARIIMYMYLRYPTQCEPTNIGIGSTSYSNDLDMPNIFLEWNEEDPVSEFERNRNDVIFSYQGNRNPFIDNPYLATLIWNGPNALDSWGILSTSDLNSKTVFIHPTIAQDYVYLEGLKVSKEAMKIYNQLGQVLEFELEGNRIDVSKFSTGMYLMSIQEQQQSKLFKFLVY